MEERRVAVLAGTPVDTDMGVEYIKNKNSDMEGRRWLPLHDPVSPDCDAQVRFQYSDEDGKRAVMDNIFAYILRFRSTGAWAENTGASESWRPTICRHMP